MAKLTDDERKGLVDGLIGNCSCKEGKKLFAEEDREKLNNMSDEQLKGLSEMAANSAKASEPPKTKPPVETPPTPPANNSQEPKTLDEYMNQLPPEVQAVVNAQLRKDKEQKTKLIKKILGNKACRFEESYLANKSLEELEAWDEMLTNSAPAEPQQTYFGAGPVGIRSKNDAELDQEDMLPSPALNWSNSNPALQKK